MIQRYLSLNNIDKFDYFNDYTDTLAWLRSKIKFTYMNSAEKHKNLRLYVALRRGFRNKR